MKTTKNICRKCGKSYEVKDLFAELFGAPAPASDKWLCPDCDADDIKANKHLTYEGD